MDDRLGHFEEAASFYRKARNVERTDVSLHLQLGFDLIRLGRYQQAADELEKVLELAPQQDDARYVLALLYVQLNDYQKAIQQYECLLESRLGHRSQNIELRRVLSQLYFLEEDYSRSKDQCRALLKLDPLDELGLYFLATISLKEGREPEAVAYFKEIIAYYPEAGEARNALAYLYGEDNAHLPEALLLAEQAVEMDSLNGAYLDTLGWIYFKMGDMDQAVVYLEKASKLMFDPVIFDHLGQAYSAKNMLDEAKKAWESSIKLDQTQESARKRLKDLNLKNHDAGFKKKQ